MLDAPRIDAGPAHDRETPLRLRALAAAHLVAQPGCAPFLPALDGTAAPRGRAPLAAGTADASAHLPEVLAHATPATLPLVAAVAGAGEALDWWNAYEPDAPCGENYAERSAASLLCGPGGPISGGAGRAGFFYLREGVTYLPHAHAADEIYAILAGRAHYWSPQGWREAGPGDMVHTPSRSWHGMRTDLGPVLILWAWIGEGLDETPVFLGDVGFPEVQGLSPP